MLATPILDAAVEELATDTEDDTGIVEDDDGAVLLALVMGVELGLTLLDPPPPPPQAVTNPVSVRPINSLERGNPGWLINLSY